MKQNTSTAISIFAITAFVVGGIYLISRNGGAPAGTPVAGSSSPGGLVGKPAPSFSLQDRNGNTYSPGGLKGKKVVLFFNEGIMCYPSCWNQMLSLATDSRFQKPDTVVLSVVIDSPQEWQQAIGKMPDLGKAAMVFDASRSVSAAFRMLTVPSSMHYGSYPGHSYVVIDKGGVVRWVFDDPQMALNNDRVFAELQKLN